MRDSVGGFSQKLLSGVISPEGYAEALRAYSESIEPLCAPTATPRRKALALEMRSRSRCRACQRAHTLTPVAMDTVLPRTHTRARRSNGWIARNTFTLTARATPDWASFGLKLAPSREALAEDVHLWSTAVSAVLQRMADMHRSFDLEDARKTI